MAYSAFDNDYKKAINNILRDIYGNSPYWGEGPAGNQGIIQPITEGDDPKWSNYNYINTHWTVRNKIVIPYLEKLMDVAISTNKSYKENKGNAEFFRALWAERENIFGSHSLLKDSIIEAINKTRRSGTKRENYVKETIESMPNTTVEMVAEPGGTRDFEGVDLIIHSTNNIFPNKNGGLTAQVKPFTGLSNNKDNWVISTDSLRREYKTDLLIFGKQDGQNCHIAIFINQPKTFIFEPGKVILPKKLALLLINYNLVTRKSNFKTY